ncbi:hypothetical protein NDU88_000280 [Pleurodeles waltl]|uniref:Uncharacterized protein n=1 Tax=Pleurodeles waltl TaxID=8319 RepID=A0AAV7Q6X3_PLEWA|nr:hypothetical protein NDU88_000280 [Pleurodeles waltl]
MPCAPSVLVWAIVDYAGLRAIHRVPDWEAAGIVIWADVVTSWDGTVQTILSLTVCDAEELGVRPGAASPEGTSGGEP